MSHIPTQFHFIWFGGTIPEEWEECIWSWRDRHPRWLFNVWGEDDLFDLTNQELFDSARSLAPGSEGQFCSDIARYEILHRHGGVYVDVDMECLKPIDDLIRDEKVWAAWEETGCWVGNSILASEAGSQVLARLIGDLPTNVHLLAGKRPNRMTGPQFLTPRWLASEARTLPKNWFYPYLWNELDRRGEEFPDSYAVHHWNNARKRVAA